LGKLLFLIAKMRVFLDYASYLGFGALPVLVEMWVEGCYKMNKLENIIIVKKKYLLRVHTP